MKRSLLSLAAVLVVLAGLAEARSPRGGPPPEGETPQLPVLGEPGSRPGPPGGGPGGGEPPRQQRAPIPLDLAFGRPDKTVAEDHVIVRFAAGMPLWQQRQIVVAAGGDGHKATRRSAFARVGVAPGDSVPALLSRFEGIPGVVSAEPDPICWGMAREVTAAATFSDPLFRFQWTLERIRLPEAVDLNPTGGDGVIVAVLDSGVAFGSGTAFPSRRGIDLGGTRFLPGLDLVDGGPAFDEGVGPGIPGAERFGHGTFVAAQIAAGVNNGSSGAGIAPRATILPVRVLGTDNFGFFSDIADGIDFAVSQGARVINMSLGGSQGTEFLRAAVQRAAAAGVVMVAAAGNEALDPDAPEDVSFPARYPEVIAVGATGFDDLRADYSNPGPNVELSAPAGENAGASVGDNLPDGAVAPTFLHNFPTPGETLYATFIANGTSFAAPQVAGGAALLVALGIDDPAVIRDLLRVTVRDLDARGFDQNTGHGLIDLLEAHRGLGLTF